MTAGGETGGPAAICLWKIEAAQRFATARMRSAYELVKLVVSDRIVGAIGVSSNLYAWDWTTGASVQTFGTADVRDLALALDLRARKLVTLAQQDDG
jgi:hypothetical protein